MTDPQPDLAAFSYCLEIGRTLYMMSDLETEAPLAIHTHFGTEAGFPAQEVEACIRQTLGEQVGTQAVLRPRVASACEPEIDSLVVVEMICAIEAILGVSIPPTFVPRGGYDNAETCVKGLLAETKAIWNELVREKQHNE